MLVVLDSDSGKVLQSFPISGGVDAAAYESETRLIFTSTRDGIVHVFHEDSPDKFSETETIKTGVGAKTMGLDTRLTNFFWTRRSLHRLPPPLQSSLTPAERRFRELFMCWFTDGDGISPILTRSVRSAVQPAALEKDGTCLLRAPQPNVVSGQRYT